MYDRDLTERLREWRKKKSRKPLVLRGARQVGKTTLVDEFGKEFMHYISLNLEHKADKAVFLQTDNVHDVVDYLFAKNNISKAEKADTLLFVDEIQESFSAISMLRYFYEQEPELCVIAAGSRLQKLMKRRGRSEDETRHSFPVGRVEYLDLRPFSFLEYLAADGKRLWADMIRDKSVSNLMHAEIMKAFQTYALIGGMPEVVSEYIDTRDIVALTPIYQSLVKGYKDDVEDYAKNDAQAKILRHILNTGWQSAGETIKFVRFGNSEYTSTQIHEAMELLERAFVLNLVYPIVSTSAPAIAALARSPKLVWMDNGIVNYQADIQLEYMRQKSLLDTWRGRAAEHIVAQELRVLLDRLGKEKLYFWVRDKAGATAEADFIWQNDGQIYPIEVKAGHNAHLQSLHVFADNAKDNVTAIRVWTEPYSEQQLTTSKGTSFRLINLPFYYVGVLDKFL